MHDIQDDQNSQSLSLNKARNNQFHVDQVEEVDSSRIISLREMRNQTSKRLLIDRSHPLNKLNQSRFQRQQSNNKPPENLKQGIIVNRLNVLKKVMLFKTRILENTHLFPKDAETQNLINKERFLMAQKGQKIENNHQNSTFLAIPVFQSNNQIVQLLDYLGMFMTFFSMWIFPFIISFPKQGDILQSTYIIIILHQALDIIFQSNKAIIHQGVVLNTIIQLISNRSQIIKLYFHDQGILDCLLLMLWIFNSYNLDNFFLSLFLTIVVLILTSKRNYNRISNYIESQDFRGSQKDLIDLSILIIIIYFFAHSAACFWHFIAQNSAYLGNSWIISYGLENQSDLILYNYSFYWAIVTMTTVGYGDLTGKNYLEILFSNILMLMASCLFGYSINQIGVIVKNINESTSQYKRSLLIINSYMKNHQVSYEVQGRIRNYLKFYLQADSLAGNIQKVNEIIQKMPQSIQQDLNEDIKIKIIKKIQFLNDNFSFDVKQAVAQSMEFVQFTPQKLIYKQNEESEHFLNYITEGKVTIMEMQSDRLLELHQTGQTIGQLEFITGFNPQTSAISTEFTSVFRISRETFINILRRFPKDHEKFMDIKDSLSITRDYKVLQLKCQICQKYHQTHQCCLINLIVDLEKIVKRDNFTINKRINYRRKYFRINTRAEFDQNITKDHLEVKQSVNLIKRSAFSNSSDDEELSIPNLLPIQTVPVAKPNLRGFNHPRLRTSINISDKSEEPARNDDKIVRQSKQRKTVAIQSATKFSINRSMFDIDQNQEIDMDQLYNYFNYKRYNNFTSLSFKKTYAISVRDKQFLIQASKYIFSQVMQYIIIRTKYNKDR